MKYKLPFCGFVLLVFGAASAQVASHAPTSIAKATAPKPQAKAPAPVAVGKPVVRINGRVLTDTDLLREEYSIFPYARQHNGAIPPEWSRRFATAP